MTTVDIPMTEVARNLTLEIHVSGVNTWRARLWLGGKLMRLAVWVIGCKCEMEILK